MCLTGLQLLLMIGTFMRLHWSVSVPLGELHNGWFDMMACILWKSVVPPLDPP